MPHRPAVSRRVILAGSAASLATPALAQSPWPNRPVRVIIPWPPGGAADLTGRIYCNALAQRTGQAFVVENRGGATGTIGEQAMIQAPADGYTLMHESTPISVMAALMPDLRFVPLQEFVPVFRTMIVPQLMLVHPSNPARTPSDVIQQMRAANGDYSAGSSGIGSLQHLALELFLRAAEVKANHIPYRGGAPATTDLIAGQIKLYFGNVNSAIGYVRGGQLKALAHTSATPRITALPDLPALSETLPGFASAEWNGFFFRTATPPEIVQRLSALCNEIVADPAIAAQLRNVDLTAGPNTPEQFAAFFRGESEKWQKFIAETGIRME